MSFGIDFGTTNTAVVECLLTQHGITTTPYGENNLPFPSLVALHPEKPPMFAWEVKKARSRLVSQGYTVVGSFKTILGSTEGVRVGTHVYDPVDITALFLSYVRTEVEEMSGRVLDDAVIAIPVDFKPAQRQALREAASRAGICVKSFVSEPTAAYVKCREDLAGVSNVAVYDWGGGTLDVSLISVDHGIVSELGIAGIRLGGNDIDLMLARHMHARIAQNVGDSRSFDDLTPAEQDQIIERSEECKKRLSQDDAAPLRLMRYAGKAMIRESVTLQEFSHLIEARVEEGIRVLRGAAENADISLGQLDGILMVGGSCEMQSVYRSIERIAEPYGLRVFRPDAIQWAVAGGAAILSELQPAYRLQKAFGLLLSDDSFYPIFEAGQAVPCTADELRFGVVEDTGTAVFVFADENRVVMSRKSVPIKGFTAEGIRLNCSIDEDMIAHATIASDHAERLAVTERFNRLPFTYDIR